MELKPWADQKATADFVHLSPTVLDESDLPLPLVNQDMEVRLLENTTQSIHDLNPELTTLMNNRQFNLLNDRLLHLASDAVDNDDTKTLVDILSLLGQVAIEQQSLDSAEVYLFEALSLLGEQGDQKSKAGIYMQLGRAYLKSREVARNAGYAYDALQIGRNQLQKRQYHAAEQNIKTSIEHSLKINRFNAAASGYSTLAILHEKLGNHFEAQESLLAGIKLYASSGQIVNAEKLLTRLKTTEIEPWRLIGLEQTIEDNLVSYRQGVEQMAVAQDYKRLYHYYLNKNDHARAWHFRLLASQSLEKVSSRTMFHRQQGVLALLYNSNDDMALANSYFNQASDTFQSQGMIELNEQTAALKNRIY